MLAILPFKDYDTVQILVNRPDTLVAEVVNNEGINYILKAGIITNTTDKKNSFLEEMVITQDMAKINVAPQVIETSIIGSIGVMISEKYDHVYEDIALGRNQAVDQLISKMHSTGLIHGDLFGNNIVVNNNGEVAIIDYETSFYIKRAPLSRYLWLFQKFKLNTSHSIEDLINFDERLYYDEI